MSKMFTYKGVTMKDFILVYILPLVFAAVMVVLVMGLGGDIP